MLQYDYLIQWKTTLDMMINNSMQTNVHDKFMFLSKFEGTASTCNMFLSVNVNISPIIQINYTYLHLFYRCFMRHPTSETHQTNPH